MWQLENMFSATPTSRNSAPLRPADWDSYDIRAARVESTRDVGFSCTKKTRFEAIDSALKCTPSWYLLFMSHIIN